MRGSKVKKILAMGTAVVLSLAVIAVLGISLKVGWSLTHPGRRHVALPTAAGDLDIPPSNSEEVYKASSAGNKLWLVPGANKHVGLYKTQPKEYMQHILVLFNQMK